MLRAAALLCLAFAATVAGAALPAPPAVEARAWILIDHQSGATLAAHDADRPQEPASVTKVLTAYLAAEALAAGELALDEEILVTRRASKVEGSYTFLRPGMKARVEDVLRGMIVQSGNDAARALAERLAGDEAAFAQRMNAKARELGATATHFVNATGLPDPAHVSTPRDLARLAAALIRDHPAVYAYFKEREFTYDGIRQRNRNSLLGLDPSVDGVKTGRHDSAGFTFIASAERDGMRLIVVTLGSPTDRARDRAARGLLDWGFREFETRKLYAAAEPVGEARVWKGEASEVPVGPEADVWVTLPRGRYAELKAYMDLEPAVIAPVAPAAPLGTLRVMLGDIALAEGRLRALAAVPEGGALRRWLDAARLVFE